MQITEEIMQLAESLQSDCHKQTKELSDKSKDARYETTTNVWMFLKLAELEVRIKQLENDKNQGK